MSAEQKKGTQTQAEFEAKMTEEAVKISEEVGKIEHSSDHPYHGWNPGFHDTRACATHH